jgi:hypothetical protein
MEADTGFLTLLMNFVAPILLGAVIAYGVWWTWRRRQDPAAQACTTPLPRRARIEQPRAVYASEERDRRTGNTA